MKGRRVVVLRKIITYGLSFYGASPWLLGAPRAAASNELEIELACIDTKTRQPLLTKRYKAPQYSATSWLYVQRNDFNYPDMLAGVYREFTVDLARALGDRALALAVH